MTEKDVKGIIRDIELIDPSQSTLVAGKLIRMDLFHMGVEDWLSQESYEVADDYTRIADAAMTTAVDNMVSRIAGEQLLDELGISQSFRFDTEEIKKFRGSVLDTFAVLATYLRVLETAKQINNENGPN